MTQSVILTKIKQGFMVSGPEGFEPIVYEGLVNVLKEVKTRANYLTSKDYDTLGDKIISVDFRGDNSKTCIQATE